MRIEHVALWVRDPDALERLRAFYETYFGAIANARYASRRREGFLSYFLTFPDGGARLELMTAPGVTPLVDGECAGYAHLALSVGGRDAVNNRAARLEAAGVALAGGPRETGDGYYEVSVRDLEGNLIEITA